MTMGLHAMTNEAKVHKTADVQTNAIGAETTIWQFVVVLPGASIGASVNLCAQ